MSSESQEALAAHAARRRPSRFARPVRSALLFSLCVLCFIAALRSGLNAHRAATRIDDPDISYLPNEQTLSALALGYRTFVADLVWIAALQYSDVGRRRSLGSEYAQAIVSLDADFKTVYRWAGTSLIFAHGGVTAEGVTQANHYLALGMERYPQEAYYPYTIGTNLAFYYPAEGKAAKAAAVAKGVEYLQQAMLRPDVQKGTALLIASLLKYRDDQAPMVDFLEQAYMSEPDPEVRRGIEARLRTYAGPERRRAFERMRRERAHYRRANFDYVEPGLAAQLGSRKAFVPMTLSVTE